MIYSLLILSSPDAGASVARAHAFARAVLAAGHSIHRVFFLGDGAAAGNALAVFPQDENNPVETWAALGEEQGLDLVLCISSALRRGQLDAGEAQRYDRPDSSVHPAFTISGLGQLVDACASSDRVITFGGSA